MEPRQRGLLSFVPLSSRQMLRFVHARVADLLPVHRARLAGLMSEAHVTDEPRTIAALLTPSLLAALSPNLRLRAQRVPAEHYPGLTARQGYGSNR